MTPEQFLERNPNWRKDAIDMVTGVMHQLVDQMPMPWSEETIVLIEEAATTMTIERFEPFRHQMGDQTFGDLVLLVGEEVKKNAVAAHYQHALSTSRLQ